MSEKKVVGSTPKKRKKALIIKKGRKIPKFMEELVDEEIERELDLKAEKNNLTVMNVKNIIKSVITNKDVLKMVNQSLNGEVGCLYEPKLTRAKTKELLQKDPNVALHPVLTLTPVKSVSSPVVKVFIDNELSEDSSDDEYNPNEEEEPVSDDDDKDVSNSVASDLDSLPLTPASALVADVPDPDLLDEGLFVKPQENVGQRTRSKLSLSSTPLEVIEQSFIPPDITHDMYETACENEDWADFLKEFCQPLDNVGNETLDDVDADPEYNVLADEDAEEVDKEELRMDRGVRVSRKELNSLISELMEYTDIMNNELDNTENLRNSTIDKSSLPDELQDSVREQPTAYQKNELHEEQLISKEGIDFKTIFSFTPEQQLLLSQQMRQHVQLLTQHFLQTYNHPILHRFSSKCKESLKTLYYLGKGKASSFFKPFNLEPALKIISDWERILDDPEKNKSIINVSYNNDDFPKEMKKLVMESTAFIYPLLLPPTPFLKLDRKPTVSFIYQEEILVALWLEQFIPYMEANPNLFKKVQINQLARLIAEINMPHANLGRLSQHISAMKNKKTINPIKYYFINHATPKIQHYVVPLKEGVTASKHPVALLPKIWRHFLLERNNFIHNIR